MSPDRIRLLSFEERLSRREKSSFWNSSFYPECKVTDEQMQRFWTSSLVLRQIDINNTPKSKPNLPDSSEAQENQSPQVPDDFQI